MIILFDYTKQFDLIELNLINLNNTYFFKKKIEIKSIKLIISV